MKIHNSLYPIYVNIPSEIRDDDKHQFIVFCKDERFESLVSTLKRYKKALNLSESDVTIQVVKVNINEPSSLKMISNEGSIAGREWRQFNTNRYIRIVKKIPKDKKGNLYLFHLIMARLNNAHYETLVGYKYRQGLNNEEYDNPIWTTTSNKIQVIPKHLSEPIKFVIEHLREHGLLDNK